MQTLKSLVAAAATVALTGAAQAGLVLQSNGAEVLDTRTNLLWLFDWNSSGLRYWDDAKTWAAGLTVGGAKAGDWRLPEIGEYVDLWADPDVGSSVTGLQSKFKVVEPWQYYWSATTFTGNDGFAWVFRPLAGGPYRHGKDYLPHLSVAVRSGNGTASVPEPQTLALALMALGATLVARRRRPT